MFDSLIKKDLWGLLSYLDIGQIKFDLVFLIFKNVFLRSLASIKTDVGYMQKWNLSLDQPIWFIVSTIT